MINQEKWFYHPRNQLIMYALLLIFTPFLMLQNFLQTAIGRFSILSYNFLGRDIPYLFSVILLLFIILLILIRRQITFYRAASFLVVLLLLAIGQSSTDYYFKHKFYELQHNWHYFAYGGFAFLAYRYFYFRKFPTEKIILYTFLSAIFLSSFDEIAQVFISDRIFDICDIGKDTWGTVVGIIFVQFVLRQGKDMRGWKIRHRHLKDYYRHPFSLLFLEIWYAYFFLSVSSLLTEMQYWFIGITIPMFIFLIFFILFHLSGKAVFRIIIPALLILILLVQAYFYATYKNDNIIYNTYGLTVYKGIPIPFFDILIFENGTFRLVDKKYEFNGRDILTLYSKSSDILLIGSGRDGLGGIGFPEDFEVQFVFHNYTKTGMQLIILKTPEACQTFNRLKQEGYNVVFLIHNTR